MKLLSLFVVALTMSALVATGAFAAEADKAKKQAEIQQMAQAALPDFYKAQASLEGEVEKAYALFSTFGLSFVVGGSGGRVCRQA